MTITRYFVAQSIDGYIADARGELDWLMQFDHADVHESIERFMAGIGALAMGAATYEWMLAHGAEPWPYAGKPTWVFTHRELPRVPGADLRFTAADLAEVHAEMVRAAGEKDVWIVGGGNLAAQFARRGLIDEIQIGIAPVVLGGGAPLLPIELTRPLELIGVERFGGGFLELRYRLPK